MKEVFVLIFIFINIFFQSASCQLAPVEVADLTLKVGGRETKELFYGFAEGDQIIFNFEEEKGRKIKGVEIIELPVNTRFIDYKASLISDKKIKVNKKSVYRFSFENSSMFGRVCNVRIQRVPNSEELIYFNTDWKWETLYDTTYIQYKEEGVIYDTTYIPYMKKELVKVDTFFIQLFDRTERVHSRTHVRTEPYSYITVQFPSNDISDPYYTEENVSWSYFIGVGQEGKEAFDKANQEVSGILSGAASLIPGYGFLASLAITGITNFLTPSVGDNVNYWFITNINEQDSVFENGNGVAATGRYTKHLDSGFTIKLYNDNFRNGIDVDVKVILMRINKTYEDIKYKRQEIIPRKGTLNKKRMVVNTTKVRVCAE